MTRKAGLILAVLVMSLVFVPISVVSAQTNPVTGTGTPTCTGAWTGKLHFSPALKNGGTATSEEVSIQATAKPCASGTPVPTKGKIVGKGIISGAGANSCLQLSGTMTFNTPGFFEEIAWTPVVVDTRMDFPTLTWTTVGTHKVASGGPVTPTGSYAPGPANQALTTAQTVTGIATTCGTATGLTALNIGTVPSTGTY